MNFKNLKLSVKLFIGFGLVSLLLLAIGIRVYSIMVRLEENTNDLSQATELADNIMESKFGISQSALILMELLEANNMTDVNSEHEKFKTFSRNAIEMLKNGAEISDDETWGLEYRKVINHFSEDLQGFATDIETKLIPEMTQVVALKSSMLEVLPIVRTTQI